MVILVITERPGQSIWGRRVAYGLTLASPCWPGSEAAKGASG